MRNRRLFAALALWTLTLTGLSAQNRYVSQEAATVLGSDKYYILMAGEQSGGGMTVDLVMEAAANGSSAMTRMNMGGYEDVTLFSGGKSWTLDEEEKTWSGGGSSSSALNFGKLTFKRQYSCKIDSEPYYYDEYSSTTGMDVNLFYNSGKVSAIEISSKGQVLMAMWLHSCSSFIPENMYFALTPAWKSSDGSQKAPPTASQVWKDPAAKTELASGTRRDALVVTDRKPLSSPMYASSFGSAPAAPQTSWRTTADYSIEGIMAARDEIAAAAETMTNEELLDAMLAASDNDAQAISAGQVTGDLIEYAVARAALLPMPFFINGACALIMEAGHPEVAEKILETVYESNPADAAVACNLVECYLETGKIDQARKVLPKIIEIAPEIGKLYQLYATASFAKGDAYDAMDNLCLALSKGYCSDITAYQLRCILEVIMEPIPHLGDQADAFDKSFNRLFSDKNIELLKKAVSYGLEEPSSKPSMQSLSWDYDITSIEYTYPSLEKKKKQVMDLYEKVGKDMPGIFPCYIMGLEEEKYEENLAQMQAAGMEPDTYEASNCWAMYMLQAYYSLKLNKALGTYAYTTSDDGDYTGWMTQFYQASMNARYPKSPEKEDEKDGLSERIAEFLEHPTKEYDQFVCDEMLKMAENNLSGERAHAMNLLKEERNYYGLCIQPVLQAFWETTCSLAPYLGDERSQRFFIANAKRTCLLEYSGIYEEGIREGKSIRTAYEMLEQVKENCALILEASAREKRQAWEERQAVLQALIDDGAFFANPGSVLSKRLNVDVPIINLPFIPYKVTTGLKNGRIYLEKTNKLTGVTVGGILGLGQTYTREVVTSQIMTLADEQRAREQQYKDETKAYFANFLIGKIPVVGKMASATIDAASGTMATTVVREVYKTQDSKGNIIRQGTRTTHTTDLTGGAFIKTTTELSRHAGSYTTVMHKRTHIGYTGGFGLGLSVAVP